VEVRAINFSIAKRRSFFRATQQKEFVVYLYRCCLLARLWFCMLLSSLFARKPRRKLIIQLDKLKNSQNIVLCIESDWL